MKREEEGGGEGSGYTVFSATPARAEVAMVTGRAEAEPPSTYPIRARERERESERRERKVRVGKRQ